MKEINLLLWFNTENFVNICSKYDFNLHNNWKFQLRQNFTFITFQIRINYNSDQYFIISFTVQWYLTAKIYALIFECGFDRNIYFFLCRSNKIYQIVYFQLLYLIFGKKSFITPTTSTEVYGRMKQHNQKKQHSRNESLLSLDRSSPVASSSNYSHVLYYPLQIPKAKIIKTVNQSISVY